MLIMSFVFAVGLFARETAYAQTATMPALYNQNGAEVNSGSGTLGAGYYYLGGGPSQGGHQVYYYGNGTYYDATTQTYGGSVTDPNGTAGVVLNYANTTTTVPGVPNTGAGGQAASNWLVLLLAGAAFLVSTAYITGRAIA